MTPIGRRQFLATLGASMAGLAGVLVSCSTTDGDTASSSDVTDGTGGALAGLSFEVRRDPG